MNKIKSMISEFFFPRHTSINTEIEISPPTSFNSNNITPIPPIHPIHPIHPIPPIPPTITPFTPDLQSTIIKPIKYTNLILQKSNKCIVFDFDCTLTYNHYYYLTSNNGLYKTDDYKLDDKTIDKELLKSLFMQVKYMDDNQISSLKEKWIKNNQIIINIVMGGNERLDMIRNFFEWLKNHNVDIFISSKGMCNDIVFVLYHMDLMSYIKEINAYQDVVYFKDSSSCIVCPKSKYLSKLLKSYDTVFYVDDDPDEHNKIKNIQKFPSVKYMYFGSNIGLFKEDKGLTKEMIEIIKNQIN